MRYRSDICFMLASFEILVFPLYTRYPKGEAVFLLYGRNKERTALQYPSLSYGIKKLLFHAAVKRVKRKLLWDFQRYFTQRILQKIDEMTVFLLPLDVSYPGINQRFKKNKKNKRQRITTLWCPVIEWETGLKKTNVSGLQYFPALPSPRAV